MITLVTGARKGIGRKIAEHLLSQNHFVIGCSREATELKHERYFHFCVDLTNEKSVRDLFDTISDRWKRLDVLVNNAAVAGLTPFLMTPYASLMEMLQLNVAGTFLCSQEAARIMQRNGSGRIVNLSTCLVPLALEGHAAYIATKAAIESLTEVSAKELFPLGITVNCVAPGTTATDLSKSIPLVMQERFRSLLGTKKDSSFDDILHAIDFFLEPSSKNVTGQTLYLGGIR